jgi:hypothetical protein
VTGLARCVGDAARFLDECWGRTPLHRQAADPGGFADLFSLTDVDRVVSSSFIRTPAFRVVKDGKPVDPGRYTRTARIGGHTVSGVGDPGKVLGQLHAGATIVLQGLQRYWPPLTRFCRSLELELTFPVQANAYVTPAGSRGLAVHYDTHDVFVLQVAGRKRWAIHPPVLQDPLPSQPWGPHRGDPGEPCLEPEVRTGDCLYVPRGFPHSARGQEGLSVHLTLGVLTETWHDVLAKELVAAASDDPFFRRALPTGFAHDETSLADGVEATVARLRGWLDQVDADTVAASVARRFWRSRSTLFGGHLDQLLRLDQLGDDSPVRRREGSICHLWAEGDTLTVVLGDRELRMPAALEPAVRRIADSALKVFRPTELADLLDEPSRLVLVRRLVREGLLEAADGG